MRVLAMAMARLPVGCGARLFRAVAVGIACHCSVAGFGGQVGARAGGAQHSAAGLQIVHDREGHAPGRRHVAPVCLVRMARRCDEAGGGGLRGEGQGGGLRGGGLEQQHVHGVGLPAHDFAMHGPSWGR